MADRRFKVKKKPSEKRPQISLLILLLVLLVVSVLIFYPPNERITQGLDVQGGLSVVLQASKTDASAVSAEDMQAAQEIVERRVNLLGASEASVQLQGSSQLLVQIPGIVDQTQALNTIGQTGRLEFMNIAEISDETTRNLIDYGYAPNRDYLITSGQAAISRFVDISKITDPDLQAALDAQEPLDEGRLQEAEALVSLPEMPVNAELFYQVSLTGGADEEEGADESTTKYLPPLASYTNPLTNATLPFATLDANAIFAPIRLAPGSYTPVFTGADITQVTVGPQGPTSPHFEVSVTLNAAATERWGELTTELYPTKGKVGIVLDGYMQSAPAVQSAITSGQTSITGNYSSEEANSLKTVLQSGSLPVSLDVQTAQVVGPTLGQDALRSGVLVALIGLIIVALYLFAFYRGIGLLTAGAIGVFAILYLGLLAALSAFGLFSLSLAGIAGIVLAIGVAADSSILVLERFKEEIRMGRSVRAASITGTRHAIITSIDADLVTLVSALALFFIAVGSVKGFGLTLALGVICDIVTMLIFKAPLIRLLAPRVIASSPRFWGIREDEEIARARGEMIRGGSHG
ncbi:MAG: protein translocase subunit SecD [Coriobacteriales bacterium]|jgi:SecD/SecF fusion protein|nr:protein translocase subunit SecD [Coriobacteriales bacterium]